MAVFIVALVVVAVGAMAGAFQRKETGTVALENASALYSPFPWDNVGRKEIRNLRRF